MTLFSHNFIPAAICAAVILTGCQNADAAMLAEVSEGNWAYTVANDLINAGVVPGYNQPIPASRVMSRLEMAMIVDSAEQNQAAMDVEQQAKLAQLLQEYMYDVKKVHLLNKLDSLDVKKIDNINAGMETNNQGVQITAKEKDALLKAARLADKLEISGYARIRNDHHLSNKGNAGTETGTLKRSTSANGIDVKVNSTYKVNENWAAHANIGYRNSFSGFNELRSLSPSETQTGFTWDGFVTGRIPQLGLDVKAGKWNEWNTYGWGMDIDCDFSGIQLTQGKKDFKTFLTMGQMDIWDDNNAYEEDGVMHGDRKLEKITSLRFFYPFDKNNDINFGCSLTSAMASRYQDPDQGRVFYYFAHGHHKFDNNWDLRAGIINSNAKKDYTRTAASKTKAFGRWLQLQYKGAKLDSPNTYGITLTYRYEPALTWPTVTDWCGLNEKFIRLGVSYVPAKNILLGTCYTWGKEIDTGARNDMYRFQAELFF